MSADAGRKKVPTRQHVFLWWVGKIPCRGLEAPQRALPKIVPHGVLVPDLDLYEVEPSPLGTAAAVVYRDESGRLEITLIALDGTARQPVTTNGGQQPRFSADGRTLYYLSGEPAPNGRSANRLMRVPVTSTAQLQIGKPEAVFGTPSGVDRLDVSQYAIARDGRLLVAVEDPASRRSRTVLVQNWTALIAGR